MMDFNRAVLDIDGEQLTCTFALRSKNAVILHGAGDSHKERFYPIAKELLDQGIGVIVFDFSGHGESSGKIKELSLSRRFKQASGVIDKLAPKGQLYLVGSSMGGQTVCDLLPLYGSRVPAILLLCPAIYAEAA